MVEWFVVCEAPGDRATVARLADRLAESELSWAAGILDSLRCFRGFEPGTDFTSYTALKRLAKERSIRLHGPRGDGPEAGARLMVRRVFALLDLLDNQPEHVGVMVIHDRDKLEDPNAWLDECERFATRYRVVRAVAIPEIEAWYIVAFEPSDARERHALDTLTQELGKDPRATAHELNPGRTHQQDGAPVLRSTKRILDALLPDVAQRDERLLAHDIAMLESRGQEVGLSAFLQDLRARYLPTLGT